MIRISVKTPSLGLAALACLLFGSIASAEAIQWVTVCDPGNTADTVDMSGNLGEWNDLTGAAGTSRQTRGGHWSSDGSLGLSSPEKRVARPVFREQRSRFSSRKSGQQPLSRPGDRPE